MIVFGNLDFLIIKFNQKGVVYDKLLNIYYIYCDGETPIFWATIEGHTEIVKILAPLTDNPNASSNNGETPIYWAACNGHTEIVKILAPLTDNPNAPDYLGETPIFRAAQNGYTEIVKILAPFDRQSTIIQKLKNVFLKNE